MRVCPRFQSPRLIQPPPRSPPCPGPTSNRPAPASAESDPTIDFTLKPNAVIGVLELLQAAIEGGSLKGYDFLTTNGLVGVLHDAENDVRAIKELAAAGK